jgi:hypothetical protein
MINVLEWMWSEGSERKVPKKVISGLCFAAISEIITEMRRLATTLIHGSASGR